MNTAAILREDALFRAKQKQEAAKINAYEAELRDSSDFYRWQTDMRAQDQRTRSEQIARTRILAKASAEEAQQAKLNKLIDHRQLAARGAEESNAMRHSSTRGWTAGCACSQPCTCMCVSMPLSPSTPIWLQAPTTAAAED